MTHPLPTGRSGPNLSFRHHFEPGDTSVAPLLLLHGTGGDETDLLPLGRRIAPGAALLSPRGQVSERGMLRFFRRLSEGVFDEDDLRQRVEDLAQFVAEARTAYDIAAPIAVGVSNGANIAAALLLAKPATFAGAILLRPMTPYREPPNESLHGTPILMLSGRSDPIVSTADASALRQCFEVRGASVEHHINPAGHALTPADVMLAERWLAAHSSPVAQAR